MAPRGDPRDNVVSEEMVKLIFLPIKESLATTTSAINEASQQVKDLARLFSTPPGRGDIIKELTSLINLKFDEIKDHLESHNISCASRSKDITHSFIKSIEDHEIDMEKSIEHRISLLSLSLDNLNVIVKENKETISGFDEKLKTSTKSMTDKLNLTLSVIGLAFTLSLIAWAIATYIYDQNNETMKSLIDTIKIEQKK